MRHTRFANERYQLGMFDTTRTRIRRAVCHEGRKAIAVFKIGWAVFVLGNTCPVLVDHFKDY